MTFRFLFLLFSLISSCLASTLSTGEDTETLVQSKINNNQVMVFAKSYCPYCKKTRQLLSDLQEAILVGIDYVNLDELPGDDGPLIQEYLLEFTGQRTVPNIFIGQQHVGGNSDLQQLYGLGRLQIMLLEAEESPEL